MHLNRLTRYLPFFQIFLVGLIVFFPTFALYMNADNWLVLWGGKTTFGTVSRWDSWTTYFSPYGMSYFFMYLISKLFGYVGAPYYIASFLFRFMAASGLYIFLKSLKTSQPVAFLGAILFIVSPFGLEVTDWVFQMTSYVSIFFLILTFSLLFKLDSWRKVFVALFFLFWSVVVNPIRAHGTFLSIGFFGFLSVIRSTQKTRKFTILFLILTVGLFLFLLKKYTFGDPGPTQAMITPGANMIKNSITAGDPTLITKYFVNFGEGIIPNTYISVLTQAKFTESLFATPRPGIEILILCGVLLSIMFFWKRNLIKEKGGKYFVLLGFMTILTSAYLTNKMLFVTSLPAESRIAAVLGFVFFVTLTFILVLDFVYDKKQQFLFDILVLSLSSFFLLVPWIHDPVSYLHTYNRYLIFSALVAPLLFSDIVNSLKTRRWLGYLFMVLLIVLLLRITIAEINSMRLRHHNYYGRKIWAQIDAYLVNEEFNDTRSVVYFTSTNPARLYNLVISSFPFRMGLYYEIWDFDKLPYAIDNRADFQSMLTDGEASIRYIGKVHTFDRKDAYAFEINDDVVRKLDIGELLTE
ncbi:hypothetical protein A2803_03885 [Candidatus Woesebacteria bacterium RIFCSPHIGHO2_01_FULL_44_21]|uniref:Glycosyltransferase RgtA/B/C/D-like domain-containing protein n=1 Tax=Candidatus Woesebacteria bacterium RIFCSPHIGHO2_01_FULL_44_21 TaxID=1802503 RepID=A0A1F7YVE4_9BACT|nr:MAG: hypothetical protein A2803_03885 [Candidatus Woesebacteria bacterium RIFCSPHIGHO2_01_FULL_44_21]